MPSDGEAYVYDAVRTPRGRGRDTGTLHGVKPITLVVGLIDALRERQPGLDPQRLEDLLLAGGVDRGRRADRRRRAGAGVRPGPAHRQDSDRGRRRAGLLHQPDDRQVHRRGGRHAGRGGAGGVDRAGRVAGRAPDRAARPRRRGQPDSHPAHPAAVRCRRGRLRGPAVAPARRLHGRHPRPASRAGGRGFYDYADGSRGRLWSGLAELGIGFPVWTGGVIRHVRQYAGGPAELAARYGDRFTPPAKLAARLAAGSPATVPDSQPVGAA